MINFKFDLFKVSLQNLPLRSIYFFAISPEVRMRVLYPVTESSFRTSPSFCKIQFTLNSANYINFYSDMIRADLD